MKHFLLAPLFLLAALLPSGSQAADILIVSGPMDVPENSVSQLLIKEAFLGKPARLPGGIELKALDRREAPADLRERFYQTIVNRNPTQMKAYWSQLIFTGRGFPPQFSDNLESLKKALRSSPGTISYIDPTEMDADLKILATVHVQ